MMKFLVPIKVETMPSVTTTSFSRSEECLSPELWLCENLAACFHILSQLQEHMLLPAAALPVLSVYTASSCY